MQLYLSLWRKHHFRSNYDSMTFLTFKLLKCLAFLGPAMLDIDTVNETESPFPGRFPDPDRTSNNYRSWPLTPTSHLWKAQGQHLTREVLAFCQTGWSRSPDRDLKYPGLQASLSHLQWGWWGGHGDTCMQYDLVGRPRQEELLFLGRLCGQPGKLS